MCVWRGQGGVELPGWFKRMWLVTRDTVEMASKRPCWHDTKWPTRLSHLTLLSAAVCGAAWGRAGLLCQEEDKCAFLRGGFTVGKTKDSLRKPLCTPFHSAPCVILRMKHLTVTFEQRLYTLLPAVFKGNSRAKNQPQVDTEGPLICWQFSYHQAPETPFQCFSLCHQTYIREGNWSDHAW